MLTGYWARINVIFQVTQLSGKNCALRYTPNFFASDTSVTIANKVAENVLIQILTQLSLVSEEVLDKGKFLNMKTLFYS